MEYHNQKTPSDSSLLIFSCDVFHVKDGRLWSSPITSCSIRLFADNFRRVGIVAHLSSAPPDPLKCIEWPEQYVLHPIPDVKGIMPRISQSLAVLRLSRSLARKYETVYLRMFSLPALPAAIYFTLFYRRPWFMSLHGDIEEAFTISRRGKHALIPWTLKTVMGFLARLTSKNPATLFVSGPALAEKYTPLRSDWLPFMDSGIRREDLYPERRDTCQSPPYRLIYVGEFSFRKGIDILFQAIAILKKNDFPVVLTLAGSGDRLWLDELSKQLGIEEILEYAGFVTYGTPLFERIREADILVVPSLGSEGWNRTITEANAQGLPIIASEVNSLGIAVREWSCGIAVPPGDPDSLASAIKRIITSPDERRAMIAQSLKRGEFYVYEKEFARIRAKLAEKFSGRMRPLNEIDLSMGGR